MNAEDSLLDGWMDGTLDTSTAAAGSVGHPHYCPRLQLCLRENSVSLQRTPDPVTTLRIYSRSHRCKRQRFRLRGNFRLLPWTFLDQGISTVRRGIGSHEDFFFSCLLWADDSIKVLQPLRSALSLRLSIWTTNEEESSQPEPIECEKSRSSSIEARIKQSETKSGNSPFPHPLELHAQWPRWILETIDEIFGQSGMLS